MTYSARKLLPGQEVVADITIMLDACKYCSAEFEGYGAVTLEESLTDSYTGALSISGGTPTEFYEAAYLRVGTEIIKITIVDDDTVTIVARAQFGTEADSHSSGLAAQIIHSGEADGSCYGYPNGCSTPDSYSPDAKLPLVLSTAPMAPGKRYFGGIEYNDIKHSSSEIKPGESIGSRARLAFSVLDQADNGQYTVYYKSQRSRFGTLFGKLKAHHPYLQGREVIYREGFRNAGTFDEPDYIERHFIIDTFNLSGGEFSVTALDPLILTEGKKAKVPIASPGQLSTAITGASTTFSYINAPDYYYGPASSTVYVRLDSEIIKCTVSGAAQLTIVTRGYGNTEINDHSITATIQACVRFADIHVVDAIVFIVENFTAIPAAFIDDYSAAIAGNPTAIITEYLISSPADVVDVINKFIFIGNLIMYFDEVLQKIAIKYVDELTISPITIDQDNHIKQDSVKIDDNLKEQYTRFNVSWAPFDLTKDTSATNFQLSLTQINVGVELPAKMGEVNERKAMQLPMLTLASEDTLLAISSANRIIDGAETAPEILTMTLDASSVGETQGGVLELGSILNISTGESQNSAGTLISKLYQVVKIDGNIVNGFTVKSRRYLPANPASYDFIIEAGDYENYVLADHFAPSSAGEYVVFIEAGATFFSLSTSQSAFSTGIQESGVSLKIINRGQMLGMNGIGGDAGVLSNVPGMHYGTSGLPGGDAFEAFCNCTVDNGSGLIWAGGGGGAGENSYNYGFGNYQGYSGRGGGGGQGYGVALGGTNGTSGRAESGTKLGPGLNPGPNGGEWGENGQGPQVSYGGGSFGLAGAAINSHGNVVTVTSGNSSLSIKGRRI